MKNLLKSNNFISLLNIIIKYIMGIVCNCLSLFSDSLFNISCLLKYNSVNYNTNGKNSRKENIYNIVVGAIILILSAIMLLNIFTIGNHKIEWYVVIVCLICVILSNGRDSFKYSLGFNDKNEEIINLNRHYMAMMVFPWIVIISYIISLFSKYLSILNYADMVGSLIIIGYMIIIGLKFIFINFEGMNDDYKEINKNELKDLINNAKFVKKINKFDLIRYGANYKVIVDLSIDKSLDSVNAYQLFLGLCNEIFKRFKEIEIVSISKSPYVERKAVVTNARNSRSRNSKKNTTKKNTKQKNKKR